MSNKISTNRQKKEQIIAGLSEKIEKAQSIVFTNYQGLTHKQLEDLKKALRALNAEIIVVKNTLLARALQISSANSADQISNFEGPTGALFIYEDIILPLKQLAKSIKLLGLPTIKFGILDNQALTGEQVLKLASLPSREVLLAQVVGGLKSPIYGLHRALNWNLNKLALTISAIRQNKS
ncbi:MAG: 50S ribosomal protein L10 [Candidatus Levybacteria bacterium]|nr:50S ribosomal protein L10 [Candidatus Levybacteria bacterium]